MSEIRLLTLREHYQLPIMKYIGEVPLLPSGKKTEEWLMTPVGNTFYVPYKVDIYGNISPEKINRIRGIRPTFEYDSIEDIIKNGYNVEEVEPNIWHIKGRYIPQDIIPIEEQKELLKQLQVGKLKRTRIQHYINLKTGRNMDEFEDGNRRKYAVNRNGVGKVLGFEECKPADIYAGKIDENRIICAFKVAYWELPFDTQDNHYSYNTDFYQTKIGNYLNYRLRRFIDLSTPEIVNPPQEPGER